MEVRFKRHEWMPTPEVPHVGSESKAATEETR
jgi:hypothetical protein